jgi:hypothetical protein
MVEARERRLLRSRGVEGCELRANGRRRASQCISALALGLLAAFGTPAGAASTAETSLLRLAQRASPRISVPSTVIADPASRALLSIQVDPVGSVPSQSYIVVRGLPLSVSLDGGHSLGAGSWAVPLYALQALKANIPTGISSRSELSVSLVSIDGVLLAETGTVLVIGQTSAGSLPPQTVPGPPPPKLVPPQAASRPERAWSRRPSMEERALAERLVAQGERFFTVGDVVSARLLFRRAADWGFAPAALRLAATYDPSELRRLQLQGVVADRDEARKWYERARELGEPEAEERLARLGR